METNLNILDAIETNMMNYSAYAIVNRTLPDLRDGLKPVHRRIINTMQKMNPTNVFVKSHNVEGEVMKSHPHGGTYPTIVGLVQTDNNLTPYITGKGSFGQRTSSVLHPAASRYTEIKLSDLSLEIMKDTNNHVVNYKPNYDGTLQLPEVLAVKHPTILNMPQSGIAVGMSSDIPSFNLNELNESIIKYIKTGEQTILIPDFPTGGHILNNNEMFKKINETGKGAIKIRGKANIYKNIIEIVEIPYTTTREKIIEKIIDLKKEKKLNEITSVKDLTGLDGMKIEIEVKKSCDANLVLEKIYQSTPLESSYNANMLVLYKNLPKLMGVWEIIEHWLEWRRQCIKNKINYEISKLTNELHLLKGLEKVLVDIDKAVDLIRNAPTEEEIQSLLMDYFKIDEEQASYITSMKLRKINKVHIKNKIQKINNLEVELNNKYAQLHSNDSINAIICDDLQNIVKSYGEPRRSSVITISEQAQIVRTKVKNEVEDYDVKIYVTKEGYVKKVKTSSTGALKIKAGDEIKYEFETSNKHNLIVFSGTDAHIVKINSINECKSNSLGDYLPTMLNINDIKAVSVQDDNYKFILSMFDDNRLAKVDLKSFETSRKKLANSIYDGANLVRMLTFKDDQKIEFILKNGKTKTFDTKDINIKSKRDTQGSKIGKTIVDMKL